MSALLMTCLLSLVPVPAQTCADEPAPAGAPCAPHWFEGSYNAALARSREADRPTLLAFLPSWSDYSRQLREEVLSDPDVCALLDGLTCLDVPGDTPRGAQVERLHGVTSYPVLMVLGSDGQAEDRIEGFIPPGPLVAELGRILAGQATVSDFRRRAHAAPDDLSLRAALANKLGAIGQAREAGRLIDSIRRDDPEGRTLAGARVLLQDAVDETVARAGADGAARYDLSLLRQAAHGVAHERGRFEGLAQLADLARLAGQQQEVLPAWREAWSVIPPDAVLDWGLDLAGLLRERAGFLDQEGLDFYLEVARTVAERARAQGDGEGGALPGALPPGTAFGPWLANRLDALAFAHWTRGDVEPAVALAEQCQALDPDNPEYAARPAFFLAER